MNWARETHTKTMVGRYRVGHPICCSTGDVNTYMGSTVLNGLNNCNSRRVSMNVCFCSVSQHYNSELPLCWVAIENVDDDVK